MKKTAFVHRAETSPIPLRPRRFQCFEPSRTMRRSRRLSGNPALRAPFRNRREHPRPLGTPRYLDSALYVGIAFCCTN